MLLGLLLMPVFSFPADGLQQRIEFWKAVFTEYGEHHLIFHDRNHVQLIYDVLDLSEIGIKREDRNAQRQIEDRHRQRVGDAIRAIASNAPAHWNGPTRTLAAKIGRTGVREDASILAERIHVQRGIREKFADGLKRYASLGPTVERILREEGISEDFAALPLVESSYLNTARSRTGAAGIWQFMPSTAREFMKVNARVDERLDLIIATRSAARLLLRNYAVLKDWPLAISAYNHGLAGMQRAKSQCGELLSVIIECYRGPAFGYASMNFYSEFVAALELLDEHRRRSLPTTIAASGAKPKTADVQRYRVQKGDTLIQLSKKFATPPQKIMVLNKMDSAHRLVAGRVILIPRG